MNEQFIKRLKSFSWRLGMVLIATAVDYTATNLGMFELNNSVTVILGLGLGELSKYLNTHADRSDR